MSNDALAGCTKRVTSMESSWTPSPNGDKILTGWWFGTFFSIIVGMMIQSDFHIFQGSKNHQPVEV